MKLSFRLVLLLAALVGIGVAQSPQSPEVVTIGPPVPPVEASNPPFSINISAPQQSVKSGSEIHLKIVLTNISNREVHFGATGTFAYSVEVHSLSPTTKPVGNSPMTIPPQSLRPDNMAPLTERGRKWKEDRAQQTTYATIITMKPGHSSTSDFVVSDLYDMTRPGTYAIQLQREIDINPNEIVKSNVIAVVVTP